MQQRKSLLQLDDEVYGGINTATQPQPVVPPSQPKPRKSLLELDEEVYGGAASLPAAPAAPAPAVPSTPKMGLLQRAREKTKKALSTTGNIAVGAAKGVINAPYEAANLGARIGQYASDKLNEVRGIDATPAQQAVQKTFNTGTQVPEAFKPKGMAQKVGFGTEKVVEFLAPSALISKAGAAVPKATKAARAVQTIKTTGATALKEAASGAGITATQGGSLDDVKSAGMVSAAIPVAGKASAPLRRYLSEKLAPRLVNSILRPAAKEFSFGKNPGLGVVKEGISANSREGLLKQIAQKKQEIGKTIDSVLDSQIAKNKRIDVGGLLSPVDEAMQGALESGEQTLYTRLAQLKDGITKTFSEADGKLIPGAPKNLVLTPKEAAILKRKIGDATKWTGQAFDNEVNQVRVKLYRDINDAIDAAVPSVKKLNSRYANIMSAEKSLDRAISTAQKQNMVSLPDIGIGTLGAVSSLSSDDSSPEAIAKGLTAAALYKGARSTASLSRIAKVLGKISPESQGVSAKVTPLLKGIYLRRKVNGSQNE